MLTVSCCRVMRLLLSSPWGRMKSPAWSVMMAGHWGQVALLSGSMSHWPNTRSTGQQVRRESRYRGDMVRVSIDNCSIGMFIVEIRINTKLKSPDKMMHTIQ